MREMINVYKILVKNLNRRNPLQGVWRITWNSKSAVILDVTLCNLMEVHRRFGVASTKLRDVMSQKTVMSIMSAVRTPHLGNIAVYLASVRAGLFWLRMGTSDGLL
jgi:hypothetical protein